MKMSIASKLLFCSKVSAMKTKATCELYKFNRRKDDLLK